MAINSVGSGKSYLFKKQANANVEETKETKPTENPKIASESPKVKEDTIQKAPTPDPITTYTNPEKTYKKDTQTVNKLLSEAQTRLQNFEALLSSLLENQSGTYKVSIMGTEYNVDQKTVDKAKADISEGGEQSVEKVAGRIVDMAKALTGGDKSKIDEMKKAVLKGFEQAEKAWGDKLPEISKKTYDEVMRQFENWAAE